MERVGGLSWKRRPYLPTIINQPREVVCIMYYFRIDIIDFLKISKVWNHSFNCSIKYSVATFMYGNLVTWNDLNNTMERQLCGTTEKSNCMARWKYNVHDRKCPKNR